MGSRSQVQKLVRKNIHSIIPFRLFYSTYTNHSVTVPNEQTAVAVWYQAKNSVITSKSNENIFAFHHVRKETCDHVTEIIDYWLVNSYFATHLEDSHSRKGYIDHGNERMYFLGIATGITCQCSICKEKCLISGLRWYETRTGMLSRTRLSYP